MYHRSFAFVFMIVLFLVACTPVSPEQTIPTDTAILSSTATDIPATEIPSVTSTAPTSTSQPALTTDGLSQLEVIQAGNWSRLQLLKTFPAEMPLSQSAIAISPDGKTMAVGSSEGAQIFFFDLESGQLSRTVSMGISDIGEYFNLVSMKYLPDGTLMANSTGPYAIYHMDTDGNVLSTWDGINFALSADKTIMAHHTDEKGIVLEEIANGTSLLSLDDGDALSFAFSPDGSKIAAEGVGVDYIHTAIWDIPNQTLLMTLDETANARFSPDGKFLAVTSYVESTNPLKIFSPDGATQITILNVDDPNGLDGKPPLFSLDGSVITAQIGNGSPVAWDTTNWQSLEMPALQGELYSFSPDGRILITRALDGGILLWGVVP